MVGQKISQNERIRHIMCKTELGILELQKFLLVGSMYLFTLFSVEIWWKMQFVCKEMTVFAMDGNKCVGLGSSKTDS